MVQKQHEALVEVLNTDVNIPETQIQKRRTVLI
jgi:hypothetical protein